MLGKRKPRTKTKAIAKVLDVHAEEELTTNSEDDSSSEISDEDKHRFQKNYKTTFVKRKSKKSGQADVSPQIKRRGRVTHKFPSSKALPAAQSHQQPSSTASESKLDDSIPSTSAVPGHKRADEGSRQCSQASWDATTIHGDADEMLLKILARGNQAIERIPGQNASHEEEVKSFAQYLATLMMKIPQGQAWKSYSKQLLALTMDFGSRHGLEQQKPSQQLNCSGSESLPSLATGLTNMPNSQTTNTTHRD
ncbi:uncharacterized protein LOC144015532 [Festucalex cinctus]